jgi:hypothetical protein
MPRFNTPGGKRAPGDVGETAQGDVQVLHTDGRRITYTTGEFTGNVADPVTLVTIEKAMTHLKDGKMRVRE